LKKDMFKITNACGECGGSGSVMDDDGSETDTDVATDCAGCGGTGVER
jgi:hypothetical protein